MLSRVAESIYWMSRYIERAENVARFVDVNLHLMLDLPVGVQTQWKPLVATTGDDEVFAERYGEASREEVIWFLAFDTKNPNSKVRSGISKRTVRGKGGWGQDFYGVCAIVSDTVARSIMGKGNGIRVNRYRVGSSGAFGEKMGYPFGETINFSLNRIKTMASAFRMPRDSCTTSSNAWDSHQIR